MDRLTIQEEEAMQAVRKTNGGIISDFLQVMNDPKPPYTTLASTIKNLEKKQFLSAKKIGGISSDRGKPCCKQ
jgi:BlaI family penicillinase repressor